MGTFTLPGGKKATIRENRGHTYKFSLLLGEHQEHRFGQVMPPDEDFVCTAIEGVRLAPVAAEDLHRWTVFLQVRGKTVHEECLGLITPHDSVLETRVKKLEEMINGILSVEPSLASDDPTEVTFARRRQTLMRLGYKPGSVLDHRMLVMPYLIRSCEHWAVLVRRDAPLAEAQPEVPMTLMVRGVLATEV